MAKTTSYSRILLITGIILLLAGVLISQLQPQIINPQLISSRASAIQAHLLQKEQLLDKFFLSLKEDEPKNIYTLFPQYMEIAKANGFLFFLHKNEKLELWTDNIALPSAIDSAGNNLHLIKLPNGLYLQKTALLAGGWKATALVPLQYSFPVQNQYLENDLALIEEANIFSVSTRPAKIGYPIHNLADEYLFTLQVKEQPQFHSLLGIIAFLGIMLILYFFLLQIGDFFKQKKYTHAWLLTGALVVVVIFCWKILRFPEIIFDLPLFSSQYYASSNLLSSLGDLFIFLLLITWLVFMLYLHLRPRFKNLGTFSMPAGVTLIAASLGLHHIYFRVVRGLVLNSNISFEVTNIYTLDAFSMAGILTLFLLMLSFIVFTIWLFRIYKEIDLSRAECIFTLAVSIVSYGIILYYLGHREIISLLLLVFPFIVWIILLLTVKEEKDLFRFNLIFSLLFISAFYVGIQIDNYNSRKEIEHQKFLATTLATERDAVAENLFNYLFNRVQEDEFVKSYFESPIFAKPVLKKRIEQLYFRGYFNKYDLEVYTYGSSLQPYKDTTWISYAYLSKLLDQNAQPVMEGCYYYLSEMHSVPAYVADLPIAKEGSILGHLIIILRQKAFYDESIYPELLVNKQLLRTFPDENFSYAIYGNGRLTAQQGNYPYPLKWTLQRSLPFIQMQEQEFTHIIHPLAPNNFIVVSRKTSGIIQPVAVFSTLFLIFSFITFVVFFVFNLLTPKYTHDGLPTGRRRLLRNPFTFRNMLYQTKIRFTIILVVLGSMGIIAVATITFIRYKYNQEQQKALSSKLKQVLNRLEKRVDDREINISNNDNLNTLIRDLSDLYQMDINVYDKTGNLVTSSQPVIFERNIISRKMNGSAYYGLYFLQKSLLVQNEYIGNLRYLAAYAPLFNENREVIAYLHLPYFSKETDLRNEISNFFVTLINLYVLLFIMVSLISILLSNTFTRPLALIREKMRKTRIGKKNEIINYTSRDEIGQLIKEYNQMIAELERSAERLATTEREGAWREMAKQVAHEIKNPLTPMKLNVQRLQHAWNEQRPDLDQIFHKVTNIIIQQIDTLSQIATEFSAFAKMPEGQKKVIDLNKVLLSVIGLFESSKNITIDYKFPEKPSLVLLDENQLSRVFNNLLKNAIQAIPPDTEGNIQVKVRHIKETVLIEIADNGIGIPEDKQDKIFSPNFSTKTSGMGLGLAIVKKIVEGTDGKIWFNSLPGKGTSFYLSFPLYGE